MIVTTPRMGTLQLMLEDLFRRLDTDYIDPPATTARTLELGVRHSPEFSCLPLKVTLGNFIEAIEAGADTMVMAGGCGPCRFGYYAEVQKEILKNIGYDVDWIILESPKIGFLSFVRTFRKMAPHKSIRYIWRQVKISFQKAQAFDAIERQLLTNRGYSTVPGAAEKAYNEAVDILRAADTPDEITAAREAALAHMENNTPMDKEAPVLRVGIVGEFYLLLEPAVNLDIEKWLGERRVVIERSIYTSDWIAPGTKYPVAGLTHHQVEQLAEPYLKHTVGGDGIETIAHTIHYAERGFDGVIQVMPFTCMPETIAKTLLPHVARDVDIPLMSFVMDEQTGKAGVVTRLEAMIDLMWARRGAKEGSDEWLPAGAPAS